MKWLFYYLLELLASASSAQYDPRWSGKIAVVTGASSGIGAQIAVDLASQGITVIGLARRDDKIRDLSKQVKGNLYGCKCDLKKENDIKRCFNWIEETLGGVDILINNAGVFHIGKIENGTTKDWTDSLNVNVLAMTIATREALKSMRKRGDNGNIININSISGHIVTRINRVPSGMYSASKFAVTALTESLRQELGDAGSKIKVTSLSPGGVQTWWDPNAAKKYPYMLPADVSEAVVYILKTRPGVHVKELTIQGVGVDYCN